MDVTEQLAPGRVIAERYRLVDPIGRGGMGMVWRAEDLEAESQVALKIVTPSGRGASKTALGRFVREARAMARLRSPHVVRVLDQNSEASLAYIAMELLHGTSLRDRLRASGALDPGTALRVLTHVGRAVSLAHQRGIVHRDLKPGNIFLCGPAAKPECKVLDFGMAKSLATPLATIDPVSTERGRPLGTPYYMSPEQARGEASVDHRADVWALGVIAFECLCGRRPFQGKSLARVFAQIATAPLPSASAIAGLPEGLDAWLARALCRDVQQRFQSAKVMIDELREALGATSALALSLGASHSATLTAVVQTAMQPPGFGERTVRRPASTSSSSFVGRGDELDTLDEAVASHCRVLAIAGPTGIGKSRLAHEYGLQRAERYAGGVWSCDLHDVEDAESLWVRLAVSLGVSLDAGDPARRIGRSLTALGRALLVLDGPRAVREPLTLALRHWLRAAPRTHFLVTGVQRLALPTVCELVLDPLAPPAASASDFDELRLSPAAALFMRRALAFNRRVLDRVEQVGAIGLVCRRAVGNPLAIELAASCADDLSPAEIAEQLAGAQVHAGGTTIIHPDTVLGSIVGWRVARLAPHERAALIQCAVFRGGFTIEAGEAVVDLGRWPSAPPLAEIAPRLVRRTLLEQRQNCDGEARYGLHPAVRNWSATQNGGGAELPEPQASTATPRMGSRWARHARHFALLGSRGALMAWRRHGGWLRRARYADEWHNLRAAHAYAAQQHAADEVVATRLAMAGLLSSVGRHPAAAELLAQSVSDAPSRACAADASLAQGQALLACGRHEAGGAALDRAYRWLQELRDSARLAAVVCAMGELHLDCGRAGAARACYQRGRELAAGSQATAELAWAEQGIGSTLAGTAALDDARELLTRAQAAMGRLGARRMQIVGLEKLAEVLLAQARLVEARLNLEVALRLAREIGDRLAEAEVLGRLGVLSGNEGKHAAAAHQLDEAIGRSREVGAIELEAQWLAARAELSAARGEAQRSAELMGEARHLIVDEPPSEARAAVCASELRLALAAADRQSAPELLAKLDGVLGAIPAGRALGLRRMALALQQQVGALCGGSVLPPPTPSRRP